MTARSEEIAADPGLTALVLIARMHGIAADPTQLRHTIGLRTECFGERELVLAARSIGLKARAVTVTEARLSKAPMPALLLDSGGEHCVLAGCDGTKALVFERGAATPTVVSPSEVITRSNGRLLLLASRASLAGELARFDFSWFIPAVVKYRRLLLEVLSVSLVLQVFGLVTPLMFQVVMDKVLVNRAYTTLNVVCVALLASAVFEVLLTGLRNYVFAHTTNRIDVELGARLFRHLVTLRFSPIPGSSSSTRRKLIPSARVKVVQPAITGIVRQIHVHDGQRVTQGQALIELDPTQATADGRTSKSRRLSLVLRSRPIYQPCRLRGRTFTTIRRPTSPDTRR